MNIPKEHHALMPYLMVTGAEKFTEFVKNVFDAEHSFSRMREDGKTVMHSEIQINDSTIMFCDATEQWKPQAAGLFVYVNNAGESYQKALANGAITVMGLSDQEYGLTCCVPDPFGNTWWITSIK